MGQSQPGQVPLNWIRQGLLPPPPPPPDQIQSWSFHASSPGNPRSKPRWLDANPQRGVKEISQFKLRYEASEHWVPSMGLRMCQLVATICVALFLALAALGISDPLTGFTFEP
jgi:hypothetical protein